MDKNTKELPEIVLNGDTYKGKVTGTLDGFSIIVEEAPNYKPDTHVNIESPDSKTKIRGEVVRIDDSGNDIRIGFRIDGGFKGALKDLKPADILTGLHGSKRTGILEVKSDLAVIKIFIKDGDIISAESANKDDDLGMLLFREGKITLDEYNTAVNISERTGQGVGNILVDLESLTYEELSLAQQHQIEEIILSIFTLDGGMFEFQEVTVPADDLIIVQKSFADLIYRGMKRINNFLYIEQICPPLESKLNLYSDSLNIIKTFDLDDSARNLLFHINSMFSIKTLLSHSLSKDFETLKTICAFLKIGLVKEKSDDEVPVSLAFEEIFGKSEEEAPAEFLKKIEEMYSKCEKVGYFEVLGLEETADIKEIKKAYYEISEQFHPEKQYSYPSEEIERKLIKIISYTTEAYESLLEKVNTGETVAVTEDIDEPPSIGDADAEKQETAEEESPAPDAEEQKTEGDEVVEEEQAEAEDETAEEEPPAPDAEEQKTEGDEVEEEEEQVLEELSADDAVEQKDEDKDKELQDVMAGVGLDNAPVRKKRSTKKIWLYASVISVAVIITAVILSMVFIDFNKETGVQAVAKGRDILAEDHEGRVAKSVRVIPVASMLVVPLPPFRDKLFSALPDRTVEER